MDGVESCRAVLRVNVGPELVAADLAGRGRLDSEHALGRRASDAIPAINCGRLDAAAFGQPGHADQFDGALELLEFVVHTTDVSINKIF